MTSGRSSSSRRNDVDTPPMLKAPTDRTVAARGAGVCHPRYGRDPHHAGVVGPAHLFTGRLVEDDLEDRVAQGEVADQLGHPLFEWSPPQDVAQPHLGPFAQLPDPSSLTQPAFPAGSLIAPVVRLRLKRTIALLLVDAA